MEYVQKQANQIDKNIQVTYDYSKNYEDGKLPVLDLKVWIGLNKDGDYKILHSHYVKDVTSRLLIHSRSAHDPKVKFNVCVNEALRIIKNCSEQLEWKECITHLEYFTKRLQYSGYDLQYRYDVIKTALIRYEKLKIEYNSDGKFFKNLIRKRIERRKENTHKKHSWYSRNGRYQSVMFIPATPKCELKNRIQNTANKYKIPIKIIENVNESVKKNLQKSNPFKRSECGRQDCKMCQMGCKTSCRIRGMVYELKCDPCQKILYRGQTSRSGYERINEHFEDWKQSKSKIKNIKRDNNKKKNQQSMKDNEEKIPILHSHALKYHNDNGYEVDIRVISRNFGDPMKRLITESVLIDELKDEDVLNSKSEWSYVRLPKVLVTSQ